MTSCLTRLWDLSPPPLLSVEPLQCVKPDRHGVYNVAMASVQNQSERPGSEWGVYLFFFLLLLLFTGNGLNNSWQPFATDLFKRTDGGQHRTYKDGLISSKTRNDSRKTLFITSAIHFKNNFSSNVKCLYFLGSAGQGN